MDLLLVYMADYTGNKKNTGSLKLLRASALSYVLPVGSVDQFDVFDITPFC
jgi:hypothetical protein